MSLQYAEAPTVLRACLKDCGRDRILNQTTYLDYRNRLQKLSGLGY